MTDPSISAYDEFTIESAAQYLQTVVLIDDHIFENKSGNVAAPLTKPLAASRKASSKRAIPSTDKSGIEIENAESSAESEEVSFHDIQNSFAKKRIICSLYQPKKGALFGKKSDVYALCSTADVIIVDWDLDGDLGAGATKLVATVVGQSRATTPYQLRLIIIYTLDPNLGAVASKIYDNLVDLLGKEGVKADRDSGGLVFTSENSRVVVLGKREDSALTQFSSHWVLESALATRVIEEFSHLASGLLQSVVLRGFANLRENNHRILTRFNKDLDIAFLTHRAISLPEETFGQIIPLLTDELRAVLEDTQDKSLPGDNSTVKEILDGWCKNNWKKKEDAALSIDDDARAMRLAKDIFCNGPMIIEGHSQKVRDKTKGLVNKKSSEWKNNKQQKKVAEYLTGDCKVDHCHEKLGSLMSQRARYDNAQRDLHLGVIVKELAGLKRYLLCLQPVCDSVRMGGKCGRFLFCVLDERAENQTFTHAVLDDIGRVIRLRYQPKVSKVFVSNFTGNKDVVKAKEREEGQFFFRDEDKKDYEWIAELKTEHAQRVAEQFGRELSRVGLTESEWLRIKAKME